MKEAISHIFTPITTTVTTIILFVFIGVALIISVWVWRYNYGKKTYRCVINFFSKGKCCAQFLSHGGLLVFSLGVVLLLICALFVKWDESYTPRMRQIVYTFYGDTLRNYKLSYFKIIKDEKNLKAKDDTTLCENDAFIEYKYKPTISNRVKNTIMDAHISDSIDLVSRLVLYDNNGLKIKKRGLSEWTNNRSLRDSNKKTQWHKRVYRGENKNEILYQTTVKATSHYYAHFIEGGKKKTSKEVKDDLNPYYCLWIGLNFNPDEEKHGTSIYDYIHEELYDSSQIKIRFRNKSSYYKPNELLEPVLIEEAIPQPSKITAYEWVYSGREKIKEVIDNGGIYVRAVDPVIKEKLLKRQVLYSVLAGTFITLFLDVLIRLILKWRRLRKKEEMQLQQKQQPNRNKKSKNRGVAR